MMWSILLASVSELSRTNPTCLSKSSKTRHNQRPRLKWKHRRRAPLEGLVPVTATRRTVSRNQWTRRLMNWCVVVSVNTCRLDQNGQHFADDIFICNFLNETFVFWFEFHCSLFLMEQLTISGNSLTPNRSSLFEIIRWDLLPISHQGTNSTTQPMLTPCQWDL